MPKDNFTYIFCDKEGSAFAEYTSGNIHENDEPPEEITRQYTKCMLRAARQLGYEPKKGELEKYGMA